MAKKKLEDLVEQWAKTARDQLLGRKIVAVRYLTDEELEDLGWSNRCVVLHLDDGNIIYPSQDDEGNGPGALFTNSKTEPILPVI